MAVVTVRAWVAPAVLWHVLLLWRLLLLWLLLLLSLRGDIVRSLAGIHGCIVPATGALLLLLSSSLCRKDGRQRRLPLLLLLLWRGRRRAVRTGRVLLSHVLVHHWHHALRNEKCGS